MSDEKFALRQEAKRRRAELKSPERDHLLAQTFLSSPLIRYKTFFVYLSFGSEAGTEEIIRGLLERKKRVLVPRIRNGDMLAVPYSDRLQRGAFGILQPTEGEDTPCEVVLAPLLFADGEGYRLGYGGGYYDRYFTSHPNVIRAGLMYAGQTVSRLPRSPHDVPLSVFFTEEGVKTVQEEI